MAKILQTFNKLSNNQQLSIEEAIEFINEVYSVKQSKSIDPNITIKALQSGLGNQILQHCYEYVIDYPQSFDIEITKVLMPNGKLLKIITKEIQ